VKCRMADRCRPGKNHHCRASGQTHLFGALPTVVLCQGTNAMRVRNNTSSVRSCIGKPQRQCGKIPKVAHSPQQTLLISTLHSYNPTLPLKTAHARSLPTCGQQTVRSNFECTTTTLLSSVRHQGRSTTTVMGRRSTQSKNTTYIQTNQTPR